MSSLTDAIEQGRRAHEQSVENAYTRSRRAITDPVADQEAALKLQSEQTTVANQPTAIANANRAADDTHTASQGENDFNSTNRLFQRAGQYAGAVANQLEKNPSAKPSDVMKSTPPDILKAVGLDTPEAQAHFAEVYDADPTLLRAHAQAYGSGRKVVKSDFVEKDGVKGYMQTFEGDPEPHFTPGYSKQPTGAAGAYTVAGIRHAADGSVITDDSDELVRQAGQKAASTVVGKAQGTNTAEDIAPSDAATRAAANSFQEVRNSEKAFQGAADQAISQISNLSAGYGANSGKIAGTPAYQLKQSLNTLQAQLTLGGLMDLKSKSKNGASGLGALSDREGQLLAALQGSIDSGQDPKTLRAQLNELKTVHAKRLAAQEAAFKETYGSDPDTALKKGGRATPDQSVFDAKTQALLDKYK